MSSISLGVSIVSLSVKISTASYDLKTLVISCCTVPYFGHLDKIVSTLLFKPYISTFPNLSYSRDILKDLVLVPPVA